MTRLESLGITGIESLTYYVRDLERSRRFYTGLMGFDETGVLDADGERDLRIRCAAFEAGGIRIVCCEPIGEGSHAWRYLRRHPDGVGVLNFSVADIEKTFRLLDARGATLIDDIRTFEHASGTLRTFSICTPFGDTEFRFVERRGYAPLFPGFEAHTERRGGGNRFGFTHVDHITSNFRTMGPALRWMEEVLGFEEFWGVEFHTEDVAPTDGGGSGLKSKVMWDPQSGVKFANNEPAKPNFYASQIALFVDDNRGDGIQHAALATPDLISTVRGLRDNQVAFMPTPGTYYDMLPERLERIGVGTIEEELQTLRALEILVDGDGKDSYLLQIFLQDSAGLYRESEAGPFFFELIQRKGDQGFGAGNFRALFESIERSQVAEGRV